MLFSVWNDRFVELSPDQHDEIKNQIIDNQVGNKFPFQFLVIDSHVDYLYMWINVPFCVEQLLCIYIIYRVTYLQNFISLYRVL